MKNLIKTLTATLLVTLFVACGGKHHQDQKSAAHSSRPSQHKIYGVPVSPYVAKVRMYLEARNIPYELEEALPLSISKACPGST